MTKSYLYIFVIFFCSLSFTAHAQEAKSIDVWMGIIVENIDAEMATTMDLSSEDGVFVAFTVPFGPADKQGILIGDIIDEINGNKIHDIS